MDTKAIAQAIIETVTRRGLEPCFTVWQLAVSPTTNAEWLFGVLDVERIQRVESYTAEQTVHQIQTVLRARFGAGITVQISNGTGLRYAVQLSEPKQLPTAAQYPANAPSGKLLLGETLRGALTLEWGRHILLAGMTGGGKSSAMRLIVHQALRDGFKLGIVDFQNHTFPMLEQHPRMIGKIATHPTDAEQLLQAVETEMLRRSELYRATGEYPDDLSDYNAIVQPSQQLPRWLIVIDEINSAIAASGGADGELGRLITAIANQGRKWGIFLLIAGQEFHKQAVGRFANQFGLVMCYRVQSPSTARVILPGVAVVDKILKLPTGRAVVRAGNGDTTVQSYYLDKRQFMAGVHPLSNTPQTVTVGMTAQQKRLAELITERGGKFSRQVLTELLPNSSQSELNRVVAEWAAKGWVAKDATRSNAYYLTDAVLQSHG